MKQKIAIDKILPVISDKLHITFTKAMTDDNFLYRKQDDLGLVIGKDEELTCIAKISSIKNDRDGEVLIPKGMDSTEFMTNPVVVLMHNYSELPIGKITNLEVTNDAVYAKIKLSATPRGQEIFQLIKEGVLRACSVGFIAIKSVEAGTSAFREYVTQNFNGIIGKTVRRIITEWKLIENSLVTIGANPEALVELVSLKGIKISSEMRKELNIKEPAADTEDKSETTVVEQVVEAIPEITNEVKAEVVAVEQVTEAKPIERYMKLVSLPIENVIKSQVEERVKKYYGKIY